jgi:hypothetical protein
MTLVDGINFLNYQTYFVAAAQIGKDYKKLWAKGPKPIERPRYDKPEEDKPRKVFTSVAELKGMLTASKKVIEHTNSCISSRINDGGGEIRCSCPERQPKNTEGV